MIYVLFARRHSGLSYTTRIDLDATYTWDNEGRVTARTYPSLPANTGPSLTYQYDRMGRLSGLSGTARRKLSRKNGGPQ